MRARHLISIGLLALAGCGKSDNGDSAPATNNGGPAIAVDGGAHPGTQVALDKARAGQLFRDAVLFEPPEGEQRPPDKTMAGKNVASIFEEIAGRNGQPGLWDRIRLVTADGKMVRYTAVLKTDLGNIEIELLSEAAPNHVRNFIALARAGYYNGLNFHRSFQQQVDGQSLAYLEAGCPLGTGEFGYGSVGYWLKPEISPSLKHEEGTIGAVHGEVFETAACKFYVTLNRSPGMDGGYTIFGKISKGLDVARTINKRPAVDDQDMNDRPKQPVIIREVTIRSDPDLSVVARTD